MRSTSHISSKGQVTVPVEIRHRMGLKSGDVVEFSVEQGQTILRPARTQKNPFLDFLGALPAFSNIGQDVCGRLPRKQRRQNVGVDGRPHTVSFVWDVRASSGSRSSRTHC